MATSRSMLRAAALRNDSPAAVLAEVNENLVPEIPPAMFVTCLYAIIDTNEGEWYSPMPAQPAYLRTSDGCSSCAPLVCPSG
jgi:hypothetical protein